MWNFTTSSGMSSRGRCMIVPAALSTFRCVAALEVGSEDSAREPTMAMLLAAVGLGK